MREVNTFFIRTHNCLTHTPYLMHTFLSAVVLAGIRILQWMKILFIVSLWWYLHVSPNTPATPSLCGIHFCWMLLRAHISLHLLTWLVASHGLFFRMGLTTQLKVTPVQKELSPAELFSGLMSPVPLSWECCALFGPPLELLNMTFNRTFKNDLRLLFSSQ